MNANKKRESLLVLLIGVGLCAVGCADIFGIESGELDEPSDGSTDVAQGGSGASAGSAGAGGVDASAGSGGSAGSAGTGGADASAGSGGVGGSGGTGPCGSQPCNALEQCWNTQFCVAKLVPITGGYSIDATEVTRDQYAAWLATNPDPSSGQPPYCSWNTDGCRHHFAAVSEHNIC